MKSKVVTLSIFALTTTLFGCATTELPATSQNYNPSNSARIRLFGQNQKPSIMEVQMDQNENSRPVKINVGGGLGDAFGSFVGATKSDSIGMAETENTRNLASKDGLLSKAFYREFVIPAGRQVKVYSSFIGLSTSYPMASTDTAVTYRQRSCTSGTVSFVPQAGKDYEVGFNNNGNVCSVVVFDIQTIEGKTTLVPIQSK